MYAFGIKLKYYFVVVVPMMRKINIIQI